jgi:Flp pilus assembly protein TadG
MTPVRTLLGLRASLRRFARDRRGVSAVEFAIVLPFMLTLYLGGVEVGDGMAIQFKTTIAARTVSDLASQYLTISDTDMSSILSAASSVVAPYSATSMAVTVSEITTDSKSKATITWSNSLNGTAHACNSVVTLPTNLQTPNISLIWGEVTYPYKPQMGYVLTGTINIYQSVYFYPRLANSISRACP